MVDSRGAMGKNVASGSDGYLGLGGFIAVSYEVTATPPSEH